MQRCEPLDTKKQTEYPKKSDFHENSKAKFLLGLQPAGVYFYFFFLCDSPVFWFFSWKDEKSYFKRQYRIIVFHSYYRTGWHLCRRYESLIDDIVTQGGLISINTAISNGPAIITTQTLPDIHLIHLVRRFKHMVLLISCQLSHEGVDSVEAEELKPLGSQLKLMISLVQYLKG